MASSKNLTTYSRGDVTKKQPLFTLSARYTARSNAQHSFSLTLTERNPPLSRSNHPICHSLVGAYRSPLFFASFKQHKQKHVSTSRLYRYSASNQSPLPPPPPPLTPRPSLASKESQLNAHERHVRGKTATSTRIVLVKSVPESRRLKRNRQRFRGGKSTLLKKNVA